MSRRKSRYEILSIHRVPVEVPAHDLATRLARVAKALYPHLTSSASPDLPADTVGGSISSSLHLPETNTAGSPASEEVSENAGNKPAA